ncbi:MULTISPECIES: hypothetical protein [unclassified Crossiella]|uniref:hypothetical protein n=1 Tax=unclassified Crossiella TaxID=2620835 RepID=UPI001FFEBCD6|nr:MULTISPECIES: hypothetical protein [unclassified Crossiella]MCK2237706.1 hypothetical protein [Crossiella sp. S99.2]MCK2254992.1 hypothetical protein [Crossiella sp. S99.1]
MRDLWRAGSGLTPRRVLVLVEHLPHGSATTAAFSGGAHLRGWTLDRHLLAGIWSALSGRPAPHPDRPAGARTAASVDQALP